MMNPIGHTRLPRYVRGRTGHDRFAFTASMSSPTRTPPGRGEDPQWLYSVAFAARDVWGAEARAGDEIRIDLWEPYLERA